MAKMGYAWRFFRAGGLDQVRLENADDLANLRTLDQKLWVALSLPVKGTEIDNRTLKIMDLDGDGRIRVPEVIAAVEWAAKRLKDPAEVLKPPADLALDAIDDSKPEGQAILLSARGLLNALGRPKDNNVSVGELLDHQKILAKTAFNGDGVIIADSAADPAVHAAIADIQRIQGPTEDRCGKPGIDKPRVEAFCNDLDAFAAWWAAGEQVASGLTRGDRAPIAYAAFTAVRAKIDDFFVRCRMAAYDPRYQAFLGGGEAELKALGASDLSKPDERLTALPLAQIAPGAVLDLHEGLNPAWRARIAAFVAEVVEPLLGATTRAIDEAQWQSIIARFTAYDAWFAAKKGAAVERLGIARVRELQALDTRGKVMALIMKDIATGPEIAGFEAVERLARLRRDLGELLRNFVNFSTFYGRKALACFQAGTLYLDSRSFELCVRVDDPAVHSVMALHSKIYLAYCKCTRITGEVMFIAAAVTQGDSDYLTVGRNGIFYDRLGRDWDATIVKILDNPISIRQAFWSPYKKVIRLVQEQIEKLAAAREKSVHEAGATKVAAAGQVIEAPPVAGPPVKKEPFDIARFAGVFGVIGLALASIGGMISGFVAAILALAWWKVPLALVGLLLAISGPSVIIAWLKLRQRTLGPILEGNGWAVNGRVAVTIPLATALTAMKQLPFGALRAVKDPFAEEKRPGRWIAIGVILALLGAGAATYWYVIRPWWAKHHDHGTTTEVTVTPGAEGQPAEVKVETTTTTPAVEPAAPPKP
ncbi:MAG TPA: hypothetical protein VEL07_15260 [Planctomycetota bacterium]|nr:hypothetical protein [Planctomycetota bacterium]